MADVRDGRCETADPDRASVRRQTRCGWAKPEVDGRDPQSGVGPTGAKPQGGGGRKRRRASKSQFYSRIEMQAVKEEKDEKLSEVQVDVISDTEEQEDEVNDGSRQDEVFEPELPAAENNTQIRASGRKRKSRDDDIFEYYSK
ncbi:hypothetical protein N7541_009298 [Penicillium brevicompactum]|uniref:Uncharacterized protein n=1 Tax=Penicillium brevicompactum TaxID=5074 RepID=A0A9W9UH38_PENBR|nr:hypothetical protein N7541_009298 [Penicillium brevicompactum]